MPGPEKAVPDQNWIDSLFKTIDSSEAVAFCNFLTEDCQFTFGNMPTVQGRSAISDAVSGFFSSIAGLSHAVEQSWFNQDAVTSHGIVTYTRHDGSSLSVPYAVILKLDGDHVQDYRIYADTSQLYQ